MPVDEGAHARRQEDAPKPIGRADANRPGDRLSFAAHGRLDGNVGALDRLSPSDKPLAFGSQSTAAIALVEETAVQLLFKRVNMACHRRVFRAELFGCGRESPGPRDRQKISEVVPILTCFPVYHCQLLISAHRLGIYGP